MTMVRSLRGVLTDTRGTAALELAGVGALLMLGAMNAADVGRYAYQTSEVTAAAQAGAEAALVACDIDHTPATLNCPGLPDAVTRAIQATRLGAQVSLDGQIDEGYYCLNTSGVLINYSSASYKPADCSGVANAAPGAAPTLFLQVHVTYAFQPLFPGVTVAQNFSPHIARTSWMRMA